MSHLEYKNYHRWGELAKQNAGYNQAVIVNNQIHISGQGGWDPECPNDQLIFKPTALEQIDQAFYNVDRALKHMGGAGWSQVFKVRSYHVPLMPEITLHMKKNFEKWMPDHAPIWTELGVAALGALDMKVEIEVVADLGSEGARK